MKKLRVGVIGIGDISNVYLNNLKKYDAVEVVACASRGLEKAQRKAAEHGIPKAYASGMELIADPDIDIILNLTTPQAHYEYNLAALKAGKHVYTEKPLAMTFEQGRELVSLAKEKGLLIGCAPDTFLGGRLHHGRRRVVCRSRARVPPSGSGILLSAGCGSAVRHGAVLRHRAAQPARPGKARLRNGHQGRGDANCAVRSEQGTGAAGGRGYSYQRDSRV